MIIEDDLWKQNFRCSADILNNAFDFLENSCTLLSKFSGWHKYISHSDLKAALISATTSVELILKAKVASFDWRQIFHNPAEADFSKLATGGFKSVGFEKCLERLEDLMKTPLPDNIKSKVENVRKTRNKLIHYHFATNPESFAVLISNGIDAFIEFYRLYVKDDFCEEKDRTKKLEEELFKVDEYIRTRLETIKPKLAGQKRPQTYFFSECSFCLQDVFVFKDNRTVLCLFCEQEEDVEEDALIRSEIRDTTKVCPNCNLKTMIAVHKISSEEEQPWECILCGNYVHRPTKWAGGGSSIRTDLT